MACVEDEHDEFAVIDVVNDAVLADAHSPCAPTIDESFGGRRTRGLGEEFDGGLDASLRMGVKLA